MTGAAPTQRFGILVYDDVEPIDVGATYGVLSMARRVIPDIEMFVVAERRGPIALTNGLMIGAHYGYRDCPSMDVLIVTGGGGWRRQSANQATLSFLQNLPRSTIVASICTGSLILAAAGLLNGGKATTRCCGAAFESVPLRILQENYRDVEGVEALVVDRGRVVTGGGVTLGIDTTLYLIGRLFGTAAADEVARLTEYANARRANAAKVPIYIEACLP